MKRLLTGLGVFMVLFPAVSMAGGYALVNYGIGGEVHEPSLGIEIGGIFLSYLHPTGGALSFGLGVSVADTDEDPPSGLRTRATLAYDPLIKYNDGNEQEISMTFGAEMIPSLFAVTGVGYASQNTVLIGTSGGLDYEVKSETDHNVSWMLGMRYVIEGLNIGLGYHSRRGIMAGAGIAF